jgi:hypothetical protein
MTVSLSTPDAVPLLRSLLSPTAFLACLRLSGRRQTKLVPVVALPYVVSAKDATFTLPRHPAHVFVIFVESPTT